MKWSMLESKWYPRGQGTSNDIDPVDITLKIPSYPNSSARCTYISATSLFRSTKTQTIKRNRLMNWRRQTANIPNPTYSNRQDPQHMAAADIRHEIRQCSLTHPKPTHLNWHDPRNLTAECTRQKMSTVATPQLSRKITQIMVPNS